MIKFNVLIELSIKILIVKYIGRKVINQCVLLE
jgi:hypothetical protein